MTTNKPQPLELLPVITQYHLGEERRLVDARTLWQFLEVETRFNDWFSRNIKDYGFKEKKDYFCVINSSRKTAKAFYSNLSKKDERGRKPKDYLITLSMAKELAMVERNPQGKLARQYFIKCEEDLLRIAPEQINKNRTAWRIEREAVKTPYQKACTALEQNRQRQGKETKPHHYTNESNMLSSLVVGMNIQQWRQAHGITGETRDAFNAEQLAKLEYLETADRFLLDMNINDFHQRKTQLAAMLKTTEQPQGGINDTHTETR